MNVQVINRHRIDYRAWVRGCVDAFVWVRECWVFVRYVKVPEGDVLTIEVSGKDTILHIKKKVEAVNPASWVVVHRIKMRRCGR